jgi:hypothetical protein
VRVNGWRQIHERRVLLVIQEPNVVPIKVVSHRSSAGHVSDRDGPTESNQGKGVAQWGEKQLAWVRDIVEECIGNVVEPLYVYALVLGINMDDATEPEIIRKSRM